MLYFGASYSFGYNKMSYIPLFGMLKKKMFTGLPDIFNLSSPSMYSPTLTHRYLPVDTCLKWMMLYRAGPSPLMSK